MKTDDIQTEKRTKDETPRCRSRVRLLWRCVRLRGHGGDHHSRPMNRVEAGWPWNAENGCDETRHVWANQSGAVVGPCVCGAMVAEL